MQKKIIYNQNPGGFIGGCNELVEKTRKLKIDIYTISDSEYPKPLKEIGDPPLVLFVKGKIDYDYDKTIAIAGTRNISQYAAEKTNDISKFLAERGYTIVSGMARGTDAWAHRGAIGVRGRTIAVLASNLTYIYPEEHEILSREIIRNNGSLISETHIDQKFGFSDFLRRNRIISGISKAVLIIEGSKKSGSVSQYNHAKKQNKKIFTLVPKEKFFEGAYLPTKIISEGGIGIRTPEEILHKLEGKDEIVDSNNLTHFITI